tara:strand:- start:2160 stop:2636 length:477 start_codon:yes stop_codon:yes gene_type:complete
MFTLKIKARDTNVKKLYENHSTYNTGDSGIDLFCLEDIIIKPGSTVFINMGIKCEMIKSDTGTISNVSYYLYPRSSISKTPLRLANSVGIIDSGYRGYIIAAIDNIKSEEYTLKCGTRLFQLCSPTLECLQLEIVEQLSETQRGEGGFGSTNMVEPEQ